MFAHSGIILLIIAVAFFLPKALKLSTELSMFVAALAGAAAHSVMLRVTGSPHNPVSILPIRHIVEGAFTYFDVCLIFLTATFFMALLRESGGVLHCTEDRFTFHKRRTICLRSISFSFPELLPGRSDNGSGALVGSAWLGDETKRAAIIFLERECRGAPSTPHDGAAGANMPYVGLGVFLSFQWREPFSQCSGSRDGRGTGGPRQGSMNLLGSGGASWFR